MASMELMALLALRAYPKAGDLRGPVPPGWSEMLARSNPSGFSASTFVRLNGEEIVIAFAGADQLSLVDPITGWTIGLGAVTGQLTDALICYSDVVKSISGERK